MTNEEKQALIEHAKSWIADAEAARDDIPFGFDEDTEMELSLIKIAMAALTAQPVKLPEPKHCPAEYQGSLLWSESEARNKAISECATAIRAAGYEVQE